jgi:hypothetical protein
MSNSAGVEIDDSRSFFMTNTNDDTNGSNHLLFNTFSSSPSSSLYNSKLPNTREQDFIEILTSLIPSKQTFSEFYRLDLLLDDYLQQTHLFNHHPDVIHGTYARIPSFSSHKLLLIPHRIRLDLTALLTSSILFPMPKALLLETLEQLLLPCRCPVTSLCLFSQEEIHDLIALPHFVKTAIVSLARRICDKEIQELALNGFLSSKPSFPSTIAAATASTSASAVGTSLPPRDSNGFRYLSYLRNYLSSPIQRSIRPSSTSPSGDYTSTSASASASFSEMELDLLKYLPNIPTIASCPSPSSPAYRDWVTLSARHSVILFSRSSHCPSLTKPQRSISQEMILKQLRPLLVAAEMTYEDLEITTTGPSIDGRITVTPTATATGIATDISGTRTGAGAGAGAGTMTGTGTGVGGKVLSFGAGVPNGRASSLTWNAYGPVRDYQRPWVPVPVTIAGQEEQEGEEEEQQEGRLQQGSIPGSIPTVTVCTIPFLSLFSLSSTLVSSVSASCCRCLLLSLSFCRAQLVSMSPQPQP